MLMKRTNFSKISFLFALYAITFVFYIGMCQTLRVQLKPRLTAKIKILKRVLKFINIKSK